MNVGTGSCRSCARIERPSVQLTGCVVSLCMSVAASTSWTTTDSGSVEEVSLLTRGGLFKCKISRALTFCAWRMANSWPYFCFTASIIALVDVFVFMSMSLGTFSRRKANLVASARLVRWETASPICDEQSWTSKQLVIFA